MLLGLGVSLLAVFPNAAISQTTDNEELKPPPIEYLEATPDLVAQAETLYKAKKANLGFCSCVTFVKGIVGVQVSMGAAKNWPVNSSLPSIGGVVVTKESPYGHVAYIKSISGNTMTLTEANYVPCRKSERKMQIDDPMIIGFWINK